MTNDELDEMLSTLRKHGVTMYDSGAVRVQLGPKPITVADITAAMSAEPSKDVTPANPLVAHERVDLQDALWGAK